MQGGSKVSNKDRQKQYKKGIDTDAARRNREETTVQLRKSKREDSMQKRRKEEEEKEAMAEDVVPVEFDFYGLEENISAGTELDLLLEQQNISADMEFHLPEQENVELELDRIKIVFWVEGHKISAECFDLSKVLMNNYLTSIKWIDADNLFTIFLEEAKKSNLANVIEQARSGKSFNKGLESALRFYLELKYLIANIETKQEKNKLRCKAYKEILMNPTLLKYYNAFCELIDQNDKKKLVGGQRLNSFILYLYNKNSDLELAPLFQGEVHLIPPPVALPARPAPNWSQIRLLFQNILMLGHSDLDWNEKPVDNLNLAVQLFETVMPTLMDSLDVDEQVEYDVGEEWTITVNKFRSSNFSLYYTNENLEKINFDNIKSHKLTPDQVEEFERILQHPLIFQLSEEADLKIIEKDLGEDKKNLFEEQIHIPQQEKKKLTRICTSLVSASLLHMHNNELNNYFKMLQLLTKYDFESLKCRDYLQLLIEYLKKSLEEIKSVKEIKLQGQKIPQKLRLIKAQQYRNGRIEENTDDKKYELPYAATPTKNRITLSIVISELYAKEVVEQMSQESLGSPPTSPYFNIHFT